MLQKRAPHHHSMVHPQVTKRDSLQVYRLAANILNKQFHGFICYTVLTWALVNITVKLQVIHNLCSLCLQIKTIIPSTTILCTSPVPLCTCWHNALETINILAYANSITTDVCNPLGKFWTGEGVPQLSLHQCQVSKSYSKKTSPKDSSLVGCYAMSISKQLTTGNYLKTDMVATSQKRLIFKNRASEPQISQLYPCS
jgi:hypothetical protein